MSESTADAATQPGDELLLELADDYLRRYRAGEQLTLDEYVSKHPELADRIRELFPAILAMEQPAPGATVDLAATERVGEMVGRYKLLERIGEGGFGLVYMAEQQHPVRRKVALKVVKPGMDSRQVLARFEAERQALAIMDHPNIAKVFDAGATDLGRPYFVMELVRGEPITEFCDRNQFSPRDRLELFAQICHAVQHAHTKGIIHRDIKPTNVLVGMHDTTPMVKVIDFGVAKALGQELTDKTVFTGFAQLLGTPLYMSPEQAGLSVLDVDTRSDIYSLGVLLYELLTGTTPFDKERFKQAAQDEIFRVIREEEPPTPSSRLSSLALGKRAGVRASSSLASISAQRHTEPAKLTKLVRGELDWIAMKALEKDRTRRYATATGLARDIERYLHDEPVEACPPSTAYRAKLFVRRNRAVLVTISAIALALIAGILASTWQAIRATQAERLAEVRFQETEAERAKTSRQLYVSQLNLAQRAWDDNNVGRTLELLEGQQPRHMGDIDLRGWEWHYLWRLCHSAMRTLKSKSLCLAFTPDGHYLVSGSVDGTLTFWNAAGTQEIRKIKLHAGRIYSLSLSGDGKRIATGGMDGVVKLLETATGRELRSFPGHRQGLYTDDYAIALSHDGDRLAVGTPDIAIWSPTDGKLIQKLHGDVKHIRSLAFSPDGSKLASCYKDSKVRLWNLKNGDEVWTFEGNGQSVNAVAFSPDGQTVVSGCADGALNSLDVKSGKELTPFKGHDYSINRLVFDQDGERLASCSNDTTIKIWDVRTGREVQTFRGHASHLNDVAFSFIGRYIASAGWDETIRLWDAASRQEPWSHHHPEAVYSVAYSSDSKLLAAGGGDTIAVFDASTGQELWVERQSFVEFWPGTSNALRFDPDGRLLASGLADGSLVFRNARDGREVRTFKAHAGFITSLDFSLDGQSLATGGQDGMVALWDPADGRQLARLNGHQGTVTDVTFSHDGKLLASSATDGVRLWDVATGRGIASLVGHDGQTLSVVFSPDDRQIFTGSRDETIRVWDVKSGQAIRVHHAHSGSVLCLALSPDGKRLVSCSDDQTVRIWDVAMGQELQTLKDETGIIYSVAFSPDGTRLAAGANRPGKRIIVWDARVLSDDLRAELVAADLAESLFDNYSSSNDVIQALRNDASISKSVRDFAVKYVNQRRRVAQQFDE
jgi:WD40 repeat protein/serine/threonine protein kinase